MSTVDGYHCIQSSRGAEQGAHGREDRERAARCHGSTRRRHAHELRHPLGTIRNAASKLGGREVAERLQQQRPGICVVYMSGSADDTIVQHDAMHQAVGFLAKPFGPQSLISTVCAVLEEERVAPTARESAHRA